MQLRSLVGVRFFGRTEVICDVKVDRNWYYPQEKINLELDCDNSNCSKAVKYFKLRLVRQLRCRSAITGKFETFISHLKYTKYDGMAAYIR